MEPQAIPVEWHTSEIAEWLAEVAATGTSDRIDLTPEPSADVQVQRLFDASELVVQERTKQAIVMLLTEWRHGRVRNHEWLRNVLRLAAATRTARIAAPLRRIADTPWLKPGDESFETWKVLVHVAGGLATDRQLKLLLESWYFSDVIDERLCAMLFIGLCHADPESYPRYVGRYFAVRDAHPGYFIERAIARQFNHYVSPLVFLQEFEHIDRMHRMSTWHFVQASGSSPYQLDMSGFRILCAMVPGVSAMLVDQGDVEGYARHFKGILKEGQQNIRQVGDINAFPLKAFEYRRPPQRTP